MLVLTAVIVRNPRDTESPVPDEKKLTFYATAESNVRCPLLEPELNANDCIARESQSHLPYIPH